MHFTKVQISELMRKHAEKENGLHDLMEVMLESMMVAERCEFLRKIPQTRATAIVLAMPMAKAGIWNSSYPVTATATSIRRYFLIQIYGKYISFIYQISFKSFC